MTVVIHPAIRYSSLMHSFLVLAPLRYLVAFTLFLRILILRMSAASVVAHYLAQVAYELNADDWVNDIKTAQSIGIDAFALNIATNDYEVDRTDTAWGVAEGLGFKLFWSFDMNYSWNSENIANLIGRHYASSATYKWNGRVLVSTFGGYADGSNNAFWAGLKNTMSDRGQPIIFAPSQIRYRNPADASNLLSTFPSFDGFFNWWSWPDGTAADLTTETDIAYRNIIKSQRTGPYIMAVSPWQFKDLGASQPTENWVQKSDNLWNYRWKQAIDVVKPDIVEIISWNDYAESHYLADINGKVGLGDAAPNYVPGFTHAPWRIMAKYYISWYKTGTPPVIPQDQVIYWYRPHPKNVTCSGGVVPRNTAYPVDAVFATAFLKTPATIRLEIGSASTEWNAAAGVSTNSVQFSGDGNFPTARIMRNGAVIAQSTGSIPVTRACSYYNFNAFVGVVNG